MSGRVQGGGLARGLPSVEEVRPLDLPPHGARELPVGAPIAAPARRGVLGLEPPPDAAPAAYAALGEAAARLADASLSLTASPGGAPSELAAPLAAVDAMMRAARALLELRREADARALSAQERA